jgi:hypothetical protein
MSMQAADGQATQAAVSHTGTDLKGTNRTICSVSFPGDYVQSTDRCPADLWSPSDTKVQASSIWIRTVTLNRGLYEFKVAINGDWNVNYGACGTYRGDNIGLCIAEDNTKVTLTYDPATHQIQALVNCRDISQHCPPAGEEDGHKASATVGRDGNVKQVKEQEKPEEKVNVGTIQFEEWMKQLAQSMWETRVTIDNLAGAIIKPPLQPASPNPGTTDGGDRPVKVQLVELSDDLSNVTVNWEAGSFDSKGNVLLARVREDKVEEELGEGVAFVRSIAPSINGNKITARFDLSCFKPESRHGTWTLIYEDPNGSIHYKTTVKIPERSRRNTA